MTTAMPADTAPRVGLTPATQRHALDAAIAAAREATADAQLQINRAVLARTRAAAALESAVRPTVIDEAGRARLRDAYAAAEADVAAARAAHARARDLETAAATIVAALGDRTSPLVRQAATVIAEVLAFRRHGGARTAAASRRAPRRRSA